MGYLVKSELSRKMLKRIYYEAFFVAGYWQESTLPLYRNEWVWATDLVVEASMPAVPAAWLAAPGGRRIKFSVPYV